MKFLLHLLFLIPAIGFSQNTNLKFDKKYYECEDKWVAFPKSETDSTYSFGFIYLDEQAGFTLNLESQFTVEPSGKLKGFPKDTTSNIKLRLEPNLKLVAIIPDHQVAELNLPIEPDWLHFYKDTEDTIKSLVARGWHYNHVGAPNLGLKFLEQAHKINSKYDGLAFELAFAYNATSQYKKALPFIQQAIKNEPDNYLLYRELGFTQINMNDIKAAESTYEIGIKKSDDNYQKSEMAVNMAQAFYNLGDKKKFKKWEKITKQYAEKDSDFLEYLKLWGKELK